jgi:hypothetical protein
MARRCCLDLGNTITPTTSATQSLSVIGRLAHGVTGIIVTIIDGCPEAE